MPVKNTFHPDTLHSRMKKNVWMNCIEVKLHGESDARADTWARYRQRRSAP